MGRVLGSKAPLWCMKKIKGQKEGIPGSPDLRSAQRPLGIGRCGQCHLRGSDNSRCKHLPKLLSSSCLPGHGHSRCGLWNGSLDTAQELFRNVVSALYWIP